MLKKTEIHENLDSLRAAIGKIEFELSCRASGTGLTNEEARLLAIYQELEKDHVAILNGVGLLGEQK